MQNSIGKFKQISIVLQKPGILFKNLRILTSSNYPTVQYFLLKLRTRFLLIYKRVCGIFFLFCLDLKLFAKIKKPGSYTLVFYIFINKSRSKQNKTILNSLLQTLQNVYKISAKKIKLYDSWSSDRKLFSDKNPAFLEIIEVYLNLGIGFCFT